MKRQSAPAATLPPASEIAFVPACAVSVPPQPLLPTSAPGGASPLPSTRPDGRVSVKASALCAVALGARLLITNVSSAAPPRGSTGRGGGGSLGGSVLKYFARVGSAVGALVYVHVTWSPKPTVTLAVSSPRSKPLLGLEVAPV